MIYFRSSRTILLLLFLLLFQIDSSISSSSNSSSQRAAAAAAASSWRNSRFQQRSTFKPHWNVKSKSSDSISEDSAAAAAARSHAESSDDYRRDHSQIPDEDDDDLDSLYDFIDARAALSELKRKGEVDDNEVLPPLPLQELQSGTLPLLISIDAQKQFCLIHRKSNNASSSSGTERSENQAILIRYEVVDFLKKDDLTFFVQLDNSVQNHHTQTSNKGKYLLDAMYEYQKVSLCFKNNNQLAPKTLFYEFNSSYDNHSESELDDLFETISSSVTMIKSSTFHMAVLESQRLEEANKLIKKVRYASFIRVVAMGAIGIFLYRAFSKMLEIKTYI